MSAINWSNVTTFDEIPGLANTTTDGTFWTGMLYMFFAVMFLITSSMSKSFVQGLLISSFACFVIGLFLLYAGLINFIYLAVFMGIILILILYMAWKK